MNEDEECDTIKKYIAGKGEGSVDLEILYQDPYVAVAVKPAGVLSEPDGKGGGMPERLAAQLGGEIFTVHRLDRAVGGVMLFSRDRAVTGRLTAAVAERKLHKEYLAVLTGVPQEPEGVLEDLLFRDAAKNKSYVVKRPRKGVRDARLRYRLLQTVPDGDGALSLVQVQLETGRTHQSGCSLPPGSCPCWATGATAAGTGAARWPCSPGPWALTIL